MVFLSYYGTETSGRWIDQFESCKFKITPRSKAFRPVLSYNIFLLLGPWNVTAFYPGGSF